MDDPDNNPAELSNLCDFYGFCLFEIKKTLLHHLARYPARGLAGVPISILDVNCGRGDLSRSIVEWGRQQKIEIQILAVDWRKQLVHLAKDRQKAYPEITFDVREFDDPLFLQAQQFDYVISAFCFHKHTDQQAVAFLKAADRLAKRGILIFDWFRDVRAWSLVKVLAPFWRDWAVMHDASVAVQKSFTYKDMMKLLRDARLDYVKLRSHFGLQFSVIGERGLVLAAELNPMTGLVGT